MKEISHQRLAATIFPASMLDLVRAKSQKQEESHLNEIVMLTGEQQVTIRRMRLIAEEFVRSGKRIRVVRTL